MYTRRLSGCGSGTEYLAVTPWGDLYPCHQFVGNEEFPSWVMWTRELQIPEIRDEFKNCNVYAKETCKKLLCKILLQRRMCGKLL